MKRIFIAVWLLLIVVSSVLLGYFRNVEAGELRQIPTGSIPTVTSSPIAALARVTREQEQINVRSGPSTDYPMIGVLIAGQEVPALGRSPGGMWVQIAYPGAPGGVAWVYSPLVEIIGSVPIVEPPPTPTPRTTPTVDPTLAAQFIIEIPPTRLPTFTEPPPLVIPTLPQDASSAGPVNVPMGFVIVALAVIGLFGVFISMLRGS